MQFSLNRPGAAVGDSSASVFKLMEVSRHNSMDTLRGYIRRGSLFVDNAAAKVGL
jgi:hypothetical protein